MTERFSTLLTLIGFLACMALLMLDKMGAPLRLSHTHSTHRCLSSVSPLVLNEMGDLGVCLPANFTRIGLLPGVNSLVAVSGVLAEGFPAFVTLVGLFTSVGVWC